MSDFHETWHMHAIGFVDQLCHARDLFSFVANTLQIGNGLDDRHNHA